MNFIQRAVIVAGLILILAMGLYPPWKAIYQADNGTYAERNIGYRFFRNQPMVSDQMEALHKMFNSASPYEYHFSFVFDYVRLTLQWVFAVLMTLGLVLVLGDRR